MAEQPKIRAKAWAAGVDGARRRAAVWLPDGLTERANGLRQALSQWLAAEVAPGRLLPWLPVAFGAGIALYFAADREPAWWAAVALALTTIAVAVVARRRPVGFPLALGLAAIVCGFCLVTLHSLRIAHPVLPVSTWTAQLAGFVETREEREKSDRIVVRVHRFDAARINEKPERVRVSVRKGSAPAVGAYVAFKAHLSPPLAPLRPGGYDFARDMYFQQIGASGYVLGKIRTEAPPVEGGAWLRYAAFFDTLREAMDRRIRAIIPGDRGSIASALITGKRDAISTPVNDAMYISSLAHVLSISGYHMAVVAGIVFFFVRAGLALVPALASRRPIKKWAAGAALFAATFYLLLSGSEVATQRSYIMIAIVLIGVMIDRAAITFRTLTAAAIGVLLLAPQAVVHPSFQMSFAATLALVAGYQFALWRADHETRKPLKIWQNPGKPGAKSRGKSRAVLACSRSVRCAQDRYFSRLRRPPASAMTSWEADRRDHPLSCHWRPVAPDVYLALGLPPAKSRAAAIARAQIITEAYVVGRADIDSWISYSRRQAFYAARIGRYWPTTYTYSTVVPAVDQLAASGLLDHQKMPPGHRGEQSRFKASGALIALLNQAPFTIIHDPREVVILRDKDGNLIDYNETHRSARLRRNVQEINEAILATAIGIKDGTICEGDPVGQFR